MNSKDWIYINSSEFCQKIADGTHDSPKRKEAGRPLVTSKHIKGYNIDFENTYFISEEDYTKINLRSKVDQWDVLISMIGEYCGFSYVERNVNISYAVKNVGILKTGNKVKALWLYYYFNSPIGKEQIKGFRSGTSQPYISLTALRSLQILIPKNAKQMERIVSILSSLDDKIELNRQANQTLEAIAQTLFKEWFISFNYPGATGEMQDSELGPIPEGWRVGAIGELFDFVIGGDWGKDVIEGEYCNRVNVIRGTDINDILNGNIESIPIRFIKSSNFEKRKLQEGDIVFEISGGSKDQATGRNIFITSEILNLLGDNVIPASFCRLIRTKNISTAVFLGTYLRIFYEKGGTWDYQLQSTGISNFQFKYFETKELIVIPAKETLGEFVKHGLSLYKQIGANIKQAQILTQLRDTLLPKLMRGEIEV
jgi:type I restriction enzyme S subunit